MMLYLMILISSIFGCRDNINEKLDHKKNGQLTTMSAFISATIKDIPVGKHLDPIMESYKKDHFLQESGESLFEKPCDIDSKLSGLASSIDGKFGRYVRFYFYKDTCSSLFLEDSVLSSTHFDSCVKLISSHYGEPLYDHYSPGGGFTDNRIGHYTWKTSNLKIEALWWGSHDGYYISIEDVKLETKLQKLFSDSLPPQPM
jgi:hypothetical protein